MILNCLVEGSKESSSI